MAHLRDRGLPEVRAAAAEARQILARIGARPFLGQLEALVTPGSAGSDDGDAVEAPREAPTAVDPATCACGGTFAPPEARRHGSRADSVHPRVQLGPPRLRDRARLCTRGYRTCTRVSKGMCGCTHGAAVCIRCTSAAGGRDPVGRPAAGGATGWGRPAAGGRDPVGRLATGWGRPARDRVRRPGRDRVRRPAAGSVPTHGTAALTRRRPRPAPGRPPAHPPQHAIDKVYYRATDKVYYAAPAARR